MSDAAAPCALSPEQLLAQAREAAWRALDRRELTVAEMRRALDRRRVVPECAAAVIEEMLEGGWLDDRRYAERFAEDRRRLDGWGAERIARRLRQLGVASEHVAAALAQRGAEEEMAAALELLRRRFPDPIATPRDAQRALGVLVRRGYGLEMARDALRRHAGAGEFD